MGGHLQFYVSWRCLRCGATREDRVVGDQPYYIANARLREGFNLLRELKTQERSRRRILLSGTTHLLPLRQRRGS